MKITPFRVFVFSVIALLGLVSAVVVLQGFFTGPAPTDQQVDGKSERDPSTITEPVASVPGPEKPPAPSEELSAKEKQWVAGVEEKMEQANRPLEVFGKVVDQHGNPVPGVKVVASITYYKGIFRPDFRPSHKIFSLRTDSQGRFAIRNQKGTGLLIQNLKKEGYKFIQGAKMAGRAGKYGLPVVSEVPDHPSQKNPVVIRMWKKQEPADLIRGRDGFHFTPNAGYQIMEIPGTDQSIRVRFNRKEVDSPFNSDSWNVSVKIENGGIQETKQVYLFEAPSSGYKNQWQHQELSDGKDFSSNLERKFFVRLGNGAGYASLKMDFRPYYGNTMENLDSYIGCRYRVNPHGSRNLLGKYD